MFPRAFSPEDLDDNLECRRRLELRFRLLDDIGWTKDTHRTSFEVEIDLDEVFEFLAYGREQLLEYIEAETDGWRRVRARSEPPDA